MRLPATLILALILLTVIPVPAGSDTLGECTLRIAAVTTGGEGVLGNITVRVTPGEGRVYISTSPATEVDTQGAARMAAFTATLLLGLNLEDYDFYYKLEAPSIIVGGPSAGAAMTVATIAALTGVQCSTDKVITGMIYLDSTIGPVGGLQGKLKAVAEGGGSLFIVPKGQLVYTSYERVIQRIGPLAVVRTVPVKVNLSMEGEQLGVRVEEAGSIQEAAKILLGIDIPLNNGIAVDPAGLDSIYNRLASAYKDLIAGAVDTGYEDLVGEAEAHWKVAEELAGRGLYFPASRELVDALALAQTAVWLQEAENNEYNVTPMLLKATETVNEATQRLYGTGTEAGGLASIYAWIAASRLKQAEDSLDNGSLPLVLTLRGPVIDYEPLLLISYSRWMAEYANLLQELDWPAIEDARRKSMIAASLGRSVTVYATTLFNEAGIGASVTLEEAINLVVSASVEKNSVAASYLSLAGTAMATAAIHQAFDKDALLSYAEKLAQSLAAKTGSMAASALLQAYQYYKERGDTERAWTYLDMSILAAWMLLNPGDRATQQEGYTQTPGTAAQTITVTTTTTSTVTAEECQNMQTQAPSIPGTVITGLLLGTGIGVIVGIILVYTRRP